MDRQQLDARLKKTLERVNDDINLSITLKEAIEKNDMATVNRLRKEMERRLEERKKDGWGQP